MLSYHKNYQTYRSIHSHVTASIILLMLLLLLTCFCTILALHIKSEITDIFLCGRSLNNYWGLPNQIVFFINSVATLMMLKMEFLNLSKKFHFNVEKTSENPIQRQNFNILRALYFLKLLKFQKIKCPQNLKILPLHRFLDVVIIYTNNFIS